MGLLIQGVKVPCELSLVFLDNKNIRILNNKSRNIDSETDVLSFPMLNYESGKVFKDTYLDYNFPLHYFDDDKLVLGDIAISVEKALEQSKEYGHSFLRETCYLIVHSLLHLLGYDHMVEKDKRMMREAEEEILKEYSFSSFEKYTYEN